MGKKAIDLLKSGNFTILYHDNGYCALYPGKIKYEESENVKEVAEFADQGMNGYTPEVVIALVKALGGKVDSI